MGMLRRLTAFILVKDFCWWRWRGALKRALWLCLVMGIVVWGLVRLERSAHEPGLGGVLAHQGW